MGDVDDPFRYSAYHDAAGKAHSRFEGRGFGNDPESGKPGVVLKVPDGGGNQKAGIAVGGKIKMPHRPSRVIADVLQAEGHGFFHGTRFVGGNGNFLMQEDKLLFPIQFAIRLVQFGGSFLDPQVKFVMGLLNLFFGPLLPKAKVRGHPDHENRQAPVDNDHPQLGSRWGDEKSKNPENRSRNGSAQNKTVVPRQQTDQDQCHI